MKVGAGAEMFTAKIARFFVLGFKNIAKNWGTKRFGDNSRLRYVSSTKSHKVNQGAVTSDQYVAKL